MQDREFAKFLTTEYRSRIGGVPLKGRAVNDCLSRARRVEKALGVNLDNEDLGDEGVRLLVTELKNRSDELKLSPVAIRDCATALHRYSDFCLIGKFNSAKNQPIV